ncbi:pyruvate dehydrogenase complex dihydrolipoamide acetyltransferase [Gemmatimonas aurantiaca]|uniref:pyruvate dehydrogenase complex dihydrolipoamide acetyltransferase n=1 Tax=Gemmatimonas aurantiaca TaxID=173480 RepID=UPI00301DA32C
MATKVMMEALSPTMEEGRLVKWVKNVGDAVKSGDTLAEVETDKAIMELVARGDGVLRARLVEDGTTSPIGAVIGVIAAPDEDISAFTSGGAPAAPAAATPAPEAPASSQPAAAQPATPAAPPQAPNPEPGTAATAAQGAAVRSSPLARRLAAERGLDLAAIAGSGPNGRVIRRDIEAAGTAAAPVAGTTAAAPTAAPSTGTKPTASTAPAIQIDGEYKDVALTQMRKTIARRLGESIGPVPTFYLTSEIDMTNVAKLREQMVAAGDAFKVSINDIVIKAVAIALTRHPECNAHWMGDHIRYFAAAHVGMAVATDDGLIVPVIRDAQAKGLGQIGRDARELARKARERKLTPAEYSGGTFSVSNLGMFGIDQFTAIINPPEAAILAVGTTETKPVWDGNAFVPRERMRVTMSCDHRIIDGAVGARFLQTLKQLLESPLMMLF